METMRETTNGAVLDKPISKSFVKIDAEFWEHSDFYLSIVTDKSRRADAGSWGGFCLIMCSYGGCRN